MTSDRTEWPTEIGIVQRTTSGFARGVGPRTLVQVVSLDISGSIWWEVDKLYPERTPVDFSNVVVTSDKDVVPW
jgi:hypothetical protein